MLPSDDTNVSKSGDAALSVPSKKKDEARSHKDTEDCNPTTPATPISAKQKRKLDVSKDRDAAGPLKKKRKTRCSKGERHLCPVCKLDDCNECENCM